MEDILDLTRLEAGQFSLNVASFCAHEVVAEVRELFEDSAAAKGLRFEVALAVGRRRVQSDRRRIEQVLLNLVANALKFTFEGSIGVAVRACEHGVRFEVSDTGVGIAEEHFGSLFQLFGKLQQSRDVNQTGCGLGLHISQQIVRQLGGTIDVRSEPNNENYFFFNIPNNFPN